MELTLGQGLPPYFFLVSLIPMTGSPISGITICAFSWWPKHRYGWGLWINWKTFCKITKIVTINAVLFPVNTWENLVLDIWYIRYRLLIKYLFSNEEASLLKVENVGSALVALAMMHGPCHLLMKEFHHLIHCHCTNVPALVNQCLTVSTFYQNVRKQLTNSLS